jgi:hypothetical protein
MKRSRSYFALAFFLIVLVFGVLDFFISMHHKNQNFKSKLEQARHDVFEILRKDLNKISLAKSYKKAEPKLQFLNNAEVIQDKGEQGVRGYKLTPVSYFKLEETQWKA